MSSPHSNVSQQQANASDPQGSAWVSANAGSGKTHVLVNRVVRLMLNGTAPERILCLTYTKAAAAEMSDRLFKELAGWIALSDDELIDRIHNHTGHAKFKHEHHRVARRLFTRALETPGGLKVQTIHAFCERLLQRFPVEAGVVPGFEVMDDETARTLRHNARTKVLSAIRSGDDSESARHLGVLAGYAGHDQFDVLIKQLIDKRRMIMPLISSEKTLRITIERLHAVLGTTPGTTEMSVVGDCVDSLNLDMYIRAAELLFQSSTRDKGQARLMQQLAQSQNQVQKFSLLNSIFMTAKGEPKTDAFVLTGAISRDHPEIAKFLFSERERVVGFVKQQKPARIHAATMALLHLGVAIVGAYETAKRQAGLYDFDDLILKTSQLLAHSDASQWVLYKLDGGLDHILIDEAQDTSPEQWQIIERLSEEFFAGQGAREDVERTIFAVGDRKQSIYSFQGADPSEFDRMRRHFRAQAQNAGQTLSQVPLQVSFRSTPQVLEVVDMVFAQPEAAAGLSARPDADESHSAQRIGQAGLVELWPIENPDDVEKPSPWQAPQVAQARDHPRVKLAARIADTIRQWIDSKELLEPRGRPIRYGDILILVRNRTTFTDAMVRALKLRGIPVAGADRLKLTRHIAVQDLLALARFALLPSDDLSLAAVLKSPLVARDDDRPIDDDDLFAIAHDRGRQSLWQSLHKSVSEGAPYHCALQMLQAWRARAGFQTPFDFFSRVLIQDGCRKQMLLRLGAEAAEPLDAFVSEALNFEQRHSPDLNGFITWLEGADLEIKRDMDHSGNEVRVMTVHGAKGLEANVVILPDTNNVPDGKKVPSILFEDDDAVGTVPVWRLRQQDGTDVTGKLHKGYLARLQEEENRLLYVAMTRACDRLYICGYTNRADKIEDLSWYNLVASVLKNDEYAVHGTDGNTACWRFAGKQTAEAYERKAAGGQTVTPQGPPDWALTMPPPQDHVLNWVVASKLPGDGDPEAPDLPEQTISPLAGGDTSRFKRGTLIHRLLQSLPDLPVDARHAAAQRYLRQPGHGLEDGQVLQITGEVMAVLEHPDFDEVFTPHSRAEVALAAQIDSGSGTVGLTGQIDRLVVTADEVLIVDYKTNRPPPDTIEQADPAYIRQVAAYRAALSAIYPGKTVRAALLWTNTARFMEVPTRLMDIHLPVPGPAARTVT